MPSQVILRLKCDQYLIRYLETLYGDQPIVFPKKSHFSKFLDVFLLQPPLDYVETDHGENTLSILLPYFEDKDVRSYNYLTKKRQEAFINEIRKHFKITYRSEIAKSLVCGLDRQDALAIFIEKYNLSQDTWDFLEKDFQRYLKLRRYHGLSKINKNSSD